jgi:hypothetical protein
LYGAAEGGVLLGSPVVIDSLTLVATLAR